MDPSRRLLGRVALFAALSLLTRWLSFAVEILDMDEAAHAVGSWVLRDGGRLYVDFADNKPPLLYAHYAVAQALLGQGLVPVRLFTALVTVPLTALAASAVFRHDRRGLFAGLLYLVYGACFLAHDMQAVHAELLLLLPAAWAVVLVSDPQRSRRPSAALGAGVLLALAVLFKQQAGAWLPALLIAAWRAAAPGRRLRGPLWMVAGFALPLIGTWLVFRIQGTEQALVYWTLLVNLGYAASPIGAGEALERAASYLLPFLLASAPLLWAAARGRRSLEPHLRSLVDALLLLWVASAAIGWRFFPHYFIPFLFPLSLAAGPAVAAWLRSPMDRRGRGFLVATLALFACFQVANAYLYLGGARVYRETAGVYRALTARLRADPCFPEARLFVWGHAPAFYYEAGLEGVRPAARFAAMAQARLTPYVAGHLGSVRRRAPGDPDPAPAHWDLLMEDLERSRATYVLDTAPAGLYRWNHYPVADYPRLDAYLGERYDLIDTVERVRIHRRRGCAPGAGFEENRGR
jgi:hypothetical protein